MVDVKVSRLIIAITWGGFGVLLLALFGFYTFNFYEQHESYQRHLKNIRSDIEQEKKQQLENQINSLAFELDSTFNSIKNQLKKSTKSEVKRALESISSIHNAYKDQLTKKEIINIIRESLRPVRFYNGRGYYFIIDFESRSLLRPLKPDFEGTKYSELEDKTQPVYSIVSDMMEIMKTPEQRGYIEYDWVSPLNQKTNHPKITYIEAYPELDLFVGTGEYVHSFQNQLEQEFLNKINQVSNTSGFYIGVIDHNGLLIKGLDDTQYDGMHYNEMPSSQAKFLKDVIRAIDEDKQYISHSWTTAENKIEHRKSFIKLLPNTDWILVSGYYNKDNTQQIQKEKENLDEQLNTSLKNLNYFYILFSLSSALIIFMFTRWLSKNLKEYNDALIDRQTKLQERTNNLELFERIIQNVSDGIVVTNRDNKIIFTNKAFSSITGYSKEESIGKDPSFASSGRHSREFYADMWEKIKNDNFWQGEVFNRKKDGSIFPEWLRVTTSKNSQNQILNYIGSFHDISEIKQNKEMLSYLTSYDTLTGLPNQKTAKEAIKSVLSKSEYQHFDFSLLFINFDQFKWVNDSLGHDIGDKTIIKMVARLESCLSDKDYIARISGDEFLIILQPDKNITLQTTRLAERILDSVSRPFELDNHEIMITASIGIALGPTDGNSINDLMKHGNIALHHSKDKGGNSYEFFTAEMNEIIADRLRLEAQLKLAIRNREFKLFYQPQYGARSGRMISVEALIRWPQSDGTMIPPDIFITLAEDTGHIIELGKWIIRKACAQARTWLDQQINLPISINISPVQLRDEFFVEYLKESLDKNDLPSHSIVVELTETALIGLEDNIFDKLYKLKKMGISISLDDFGTGYSSLSLLKKTPVSEIKIDKSFIDGLPETLDDLSITKSIISVAQSMNLEVVAEGVETEAQLKLLTDLECGKLQGYYFSPAVPPEEILSMI